MRALTPAPLLLLAPIAGAFSFGSPICEVETLPLVPMSPTLSNPPPTGWLLQADDQGFSDDRPLRLAILHPDPSRRTRGVLLWAKSGPDQGAGAFGFDSSLYQGLSAVGCGGWALTHTSAVPKSQQQMRFTWSPGPDDVQVLFRAFLIEDCGLPAGCRDHQALTVPVIVERVLFRSGFEGG